MQKIRIEEVGDINSDYPYLEVFLANDVAPFLEVAISGDKELSFKFYASKADILLKEEDWEFIHTRAKEFLPRALKNEEDYLNFLEE